MYDLYQVPESEVIVFRTKTDLILHGVGAVEFMIPISTFVAFDGEFSYLLYGNDLIPMGYKKFIEITREHSYTELDSMTQKEYRLKYQKELNEKLGIIDEPAHDYGDALYSLNESEDNSVAKNLMNKGIRFKIKRLD